MSANNINVMVADPIEAADLIVVGRDLELNLGPWAASCGLNMDYAGTATITVSLAEQEPGELADKTAGFFKRDKDGVRRLSKWNTLSVLGTNYVLREVARTTAGRDLVFYDEASEDLKRYTGPVKIDRGQYTRAEFIAGLAVEAGVQRLILDQDTRQVIADLAPDDLKTLHTSRASRDLKGELASADARKAGLSALRAADLGLSNIQLQAIADTLTVADQEQVNALVRLAIVCAGLGESGFDPRKTDYKTHTHKGVFQSNQIDQYDTKTQAYHFIHGGRSFRPGGAIALAGHGSTLTPGQIAASVEVSDGSYAYYDGFKAQARKILAAWSPGKTGISDSRTGSVDRARIERYEFSIPSGQNYWDGAAALAGQVRWRRFAIFNYLVYASDFQLAQADPYDFSATDEWVDDPGQWRATSNQRIDQLPISGRLNAIIPPGTAFAIKDDDPTYGTWLVRNFQRDLMDPSSNIKVTLGRPIAPLAEPASRVKTISGRDPSTEGTSGKLRKAKAGQPTVDTTSVGPLHETAGLPGYPAHDYFAPAGSPCVAPVTGIVTKLSGHDPANGPVSGVHGPFGWSVYITGGGKSYYLTHMGTRTVRLRQHVTQGQEIGTVGDYAKWGGANHIHMGVEG